MLKLLVWFLFQQPRLITSTIEKSNACSQVNTYCELKRNPTNVRLTSQRPRNNVEQRETIRERDHAFSKFVSRLGKKCAEFLPGSGAKPHRVSCRLLAAVFQRQRYARLLEIDVV